MFRCSIGATERHTSMCTQTWVVCLVSRHVTRRTEVSCSGYSSWVEKIIKMNPRMTNCTSPTVHNNQFQNYYFSQCLMMKKNPDRSKLLIINWNVGSKKIKNFMICLLSCTHMLCIEQCLAYNKCSI